MTATDQYASVRYLVDDVQVAIDFYTTHLGFSLTVSQSCFGSQSCFVGRTQRMGDEVALFRPALRFVPHCVTGGNG